MRVFSIKTAVGIIFVLILGSVFLSHAENKSSHKVCFNGYSFNVELAVTESERGKGLMFRNHLAKENGMLFVYKNEGVYSFWMRNTKIPLDMIWINGEKQVVFIKENASPCGKDKCIMIYSDKSAKYVLEVNSGSVEKIGLKVNDKLSFYNIP